MATKAYIVGVAALGCVSLLHGGCQDEAADPNPGVGLNGGVGVSGATTGSETTSVDGGTDTASTTGAPTSSTADTTTPQDGGPDTRQTEADAAAATDANPGDAGAESVSGIEPAELEMLRTLCVQTINDYRATLDLPPLARAALSQELCSDQGAKKDGDSGNPHSSANTGNPCYSPGGDGFPHFGTQNTCPNVTVGGWGASSIAEGLTRCLERMWDEGEPPVGREQCENEWFNEMPECFLAHGHYLNMSDPGATGVSCGFYEMDDGRFWMNQDFL